MQGIADPSLKAGYFHHELIKIHPVINGNGWVTRVEKIGMLMYDLYPSIFINCAPHKKEYIASISKSFIQLINFPKKWNEHTENFFEHELVRLVTNATLLYEAVNRIGETKKLNIRADGTI